MMTWEGNVVLGIADTVNAGLLGVAKDLLFGTMQAKQILRCAQDDRLVGVTEQRIE